MKYTLISTAFLLSAGLAQADTGWDVEQGKTTTSNAQPRSGSQSMQSTAIQPGIGDSASRFDNVTQGKFDFNAGDWGDLRNEEAYGAF